MDNSTDKLVRFLRLVLGTGKSHRFPPLRPQTNVSVASDGGGSYSDGEMSAYLEEVIVQCVADLPGSEKVRRLLAVVDKNRMLDDCFNDGVEEKVRNLLPSIAYRNVARAVIEDAERDDNLSTLSSTEHEYIKGGEVLLSSRAGSSHLTKLTETDWSDFLAACSEDVRRCVLRLLIRIGVADWRAFGTSFNFHRPLYSGLELILFSKHSVETVASLLREDVEESKDKPASFFCCTEMGSLLSLDTIYEIDETTEVMPDDLMKLVMGKLAPYSAHDETKLKMQTLRDALKRILIVIKVVIGNILGSENLNVQQSVLIWAVAVLNKNKDYSGLSNNTQSNHNRFCSKAFLLNFAKVLLMTLTPFLQSQTKLSDLKYYSSTKCRLSLDGLLSLDGNRMVLTENMEESTNSSGRLSRDDLAEELFFLCLRAVDICIIPIMFLYSRAVNLLDKRRKEARIKCELYKLAVWDESFCCYVAKLLVEQNKLLIQMLSKINDHENHMSPEFHRKMFCGLPEFLVVDTILWIEYCSRYQLHRTRDLKWRHALLLIQSADFFIAYLECSHVLSNPRLVVKVIKSLVDLVLESQQQTHALQKLTKRFEHVLPSLLRTYASTYDIDGTPMETEYLMIARGRYEISTLILEAWNTYDGRTFISAQSTSDIFRDFIEAVFLELLYLVQDFMSKKFRISLLRRGLEKSNGENVIDNHLLKNEVRKVHGEQRNLLDYADEHLSLLQKLTSEVTIVSVITQHPMSKDIASNICMLLNVFCDQALLDFCEIASSKPVNTSKIFIWRLAEIIFKLTRTELKTPDGFAELLTTNPHFDFKSMGAVESYGNYLKKNSAESRNVVKNMKAVLKEKMAKTKYDFWMIETLQLPFYEEALLENYQNFLGKAQLRVDHLAQSHSFRYLLKGANPAQEKMVVLTKEMQYLQRMLHLNLAGAVFLIRDKARMDTLRCMFSGPTGTPYGRGLLAFDIFCADGYPREPPLVRCISAPYGAFIFGHCIRGDGRICMKTLEATIKGDDSNRKKCGEWSIFKVLNYIKKAMLTFKVSCSAQEVKISPCKDTGCAPGHAVCKVRAMTVRHAMLESLRNPPPGFERVVCLHFATQRQAVLTECTRWVKNCIDDDFAPNFAWTVNSLYRELQVLDLAQVS